jgi:hypothetical protein
MLAPGGCRDSGHMQHQGGRGNFLFARRRVTRTERNMATGISIKMPDDLREKIEATARRVDMTTMDFIRAVLDVSCGFTDEKLNYNFDLLKRQAAMNVEGQRQVEEQKRVYEVLRQQFIDLRSMNAARMHAMGKPIPVPTRVLN